MLALLAEVDLHRPTHGLVGRPRVPDAVIEAAVLVMSATRLPARQAEGFIRAWCVSAGLDPDLAPDHTTILRRRRSLTLPTIDEGVLPARVVGAIDATGFACRKGSGWLIDKPGATDRRRAQYVKLHAFIDTRTGLLLAAAVTPAAGRATGDVSALPGLLRRVTNTLPTGSVLHALVGDGAYGSRDCYTAAARAQVRLITPPMNKATYGLHPDRDQVLAQIGRIGPPLWKRKTGYHLRSLVEAYFGALKHSLGEGLRARSLAGCRAEVLGKLMLYNRFILARLAAS